MKNLVFLIFIFLAISTASNAQYFRITNDSILAKSELILENSTKAKTGAFIRNKGNGRTDYAYAVDSGYIQNDVMYLHRGDGWIQMQLPSTSNLPGDGNNYVNLLSYFNDVLTIGRNGLGNVTTTIPLSSKVNVADTAGMLATYKKAFVKGFYNPLNNSLVMTRVNGTDTIIQGATAGWGLIFANGKYQVDSAILSGSLLEKDSIFLRSAASTITGNQIRAWDTTFRDARFDSAARILWLLRNYHYDPPRGITTDSVGIHFPSEKIDTTSISRRIDGAVKYTDTATMLNPYLRAALAATNYQPIGNYPTTAQLNLKVNISDTAGMLSPYLRSANAAATYEPKISPGTTLQYWRGDKTWQPFPTIPAQFNPIAGTGVSLSGTYPNITFNSTATGGVTSESDPLSVHVSDSAAMLANYLRAATAAATYETKIAPGTTLQYWRGDKTWQTLTIPAQFNPIAGTGVTLSGTYPNITFNSTATGGGGGSGTVTTVTASPPLSITGTPTTTPNVLADTSKAVGKLATYSDVLKKLDRDSAVQYTLSGIRDNDLLKYDSLNSRFVNFRTTFLPPLLWNYSTGTASADTITAVTGLATKAFVLNNAGSGGGSGGSGWGLTGNAGTTPGTNFIGTTDAKNVIFKRGGVQSGAIDSTLQNTSFGYQSLLSNGTGARSVGVGFRALTAQTSAADNTSVGYLALSSDTSASNNTAVGSKALQNNIIGIENTAVGAGALKTNKADYNTAVGTSSLILNSTGTQNTAVGQSSLFNNSTGSNNTAVGLNALTANTTASGNTGVGWNSLQTNATGASNTAMGQQSLRVVTSNNNTGYGFQTGVNTSSGTDNTFVGYTTGNFNTTGSFNTYVGSSTGQSSTQTNGSNSTIIGANVTGLPSTPSNYIILSDGQGKKVIYTVSTGSTAVASAAAIVPTGNVFHVTGTTTITSITATGLAAGARITMIFDGALTVTDGGNLKLAGNFNTSVDATITLAYDGTNFYETARSVN